MGFLAIAVLTAICTLATTSVFAQSRAVVISLDGATPALVQEFIADGTIPPDKGIGLLASKGTTALRNATVNPSLTAPGHIAIATGSTAARNDILANTFHLVRSPLIGNAPQFFRNTISGFAAPIGGYDLHLTETLDPTAKPLWLALRAAGKRVVAGTFAGADGVDVRLPVPGASGPIIQSADKRTVDFIVPFGAFGGIGAQGFDLTAAQFGPAPPSTATQLAAAGKVFYNLKQKTSSLTTFSVGGVAFSIQVAALDTTNDGIENYDTVVFFDQTLGIQGGPLPYRRPALPISRPRTDARVRSTFREAAPERAWRSMSLASIPICLRCASPTLPLTSFRATASTPTAWDRRALIATSRSSSTTLRNSRWCTWTGGSTGWESLAEVRMLDLLDVSQRRRSALTAIYRYIGKNLKAGAGYNFSDFSDDLTDLRYDHKGVFVNLIVTK